MLPVLTNGGPRNDNLVEKPLIILILNPRHDLIYNRSFIAAPGFCKSSAFARKIRDQDEISSPGGDARRQLRVAKKRVRFVSGDGIVRSISRIH